MAPHHCKRQHQKMKKKKNKKRIASTMAASTVRVQDAAVALFNIWVGSILAVSVDTSSICTSVCDTESVQRTQRPILISNFFDCLVPA